MKRPGPLRRVTPLRSKRKKGRTVAEREEQSAWFVAVASDSSPALTSDTETLDGLLALECHHVVPRQVCRRLGAPEWDPRNGMKVSLRRHLRHHSRREPIRLAELPPRVFEFAADFGLVEWLHRHYPA